MSSGPVNIVINGHRQAVVAASSAGVGGGLSSTNVQARRSVFERQQPQSQPQPQPQKQPQHSTAAARPSMPSGGGTTVHIVPRATNTAAGTSSAVASKAPAAVLTTEKTPMASALQSTSAAAASSQRDSPSKAPANDSKQSQVVPSFNRPGRPTVAAAESRISSSASWKVPSSSIDNKGAVEPSVGRQKSAPSASSTSSVTSSRQLSGASALGVGSGSGASGGRSWFFGTDISTAPEGTIAVRLTPSGTSQAVPATQSAQTMTPERRAQATVWDHLRSEPSKVGADPALEAEARRLIAAGGSPDGRRKKRLCFARDSIIAETFEYQSERSLMDELNITPDYPDEPFEVAAPMVRRNPLQQKPEGEERPLPPSPPLTEKKQHQHQQTSAAEAVSEASKQDPATATLDIGNYQTKLAHESKFVWGAAGASSNKVGASIRSNLSSGSEIESSDDQPVQQKQWSISTTSDLLF